MSEEFNRKSVRNFDSCNLPPCKSQLFQQCCRANYIANIWNNAHTQNLPDFSPENNGWTLDENQYQFYWFDGDQLPSFVSELLENVSGMNFICTAIHTFNNVFCIFRRFEQR